MSAASPLVAQALAGKVIALYGLRDTLLANLSATLSVPSQGLAQVAREAKRRHLLSGSAAAKLIKVDFAYNLIRHLTDERCLAYIQEIRCMIAQTSWDEPSLAKKEEKADGDGGASRAAAFRGSFRLRYFASLWAHSSSRAPCSSSRLCCCCLR